MNTTVKILTLTKEITVDDATSAIVLLSKKDEQINTYKETLSVKRVRSKFTSKHVGYFGRS